MISNVVARVLLLIITFWCGVCCAQSNAASEPGLISVYSSNGNIFLQKLASDTSYRVQTKGRQWSMVRFLQPAVSVWVSEDYVKRSNDQVSVQVNNLNVRTEPNLSSSILGQVSSEYTSQVLGSRNGFVNIYAPARWLFAVQNSEIVANADSDSSVNKSVHQGEKPQLRTPESEVAEPAEATLVGAKTKIDEVTIEEPLTEEVAPAAQAEKPIATTTNSKIARKHRLAPGDTISLLVFGEPDLSVSAARIPQSGLISFPLIGSIAVSDKTIEEVEQAVATQLSQGYVKNPRLSITIDSYRPIFIRGAVKSTGSFPYSEGLTVAKALALAGGTKNSAKRNGISVSREGDTVETGLAADSRYEILSGDIITIDEEVGVSEEATFYIYLHGEVKKPGEYVYRRGLTVEKAVVLAGGFTLRASKKKISVSRQIEGQDAPAKMKRVKLYLPVQPGDIINVGASWF